MASFNKITLIGYAAKDPDIRTISADKKVAEISIPINDNYTDRSGQQIERTAWYRVAFWNQKAEVIEKYVKKGSQLHIEGRLTVRTYTDKEGKERFSLDVLAQDFTLLGSRTEGGENGAGNSGGHNSGYSNSNNANNAGSYAPRTATREVTPSLPAGDDADDLPF
jgi:single-strand DNA-binding protein